MSKHVHRNPKRLDSFYNTLHYYHKNYFPDLRFGQLMENFLHILNLIKIKMYFIWKKKNF